VYTDVHSECTSVFADCTVDQCMFSSECICYYAALLMGHITGLARSFLPSVCPIWASNSEK